MIFEHESSRSPKGPSKKWKSQGKLCKQSLFLIQFHVHNVTLLKVDYVRDIYWVDWVLKTVFWFHITDGLFSLLRKVSELGGQKEII